MTYLVQGVGIGVLFATLGLLLKESGSKNATAAAAVLGVLFFSFVFLRISPLFAQTMQVLEGLSLQKEGAFLLKAIGVGYVSQLGGDICRDLGAQGIAAKIELLGRAELLILCMPVFLQLFENVRILTG